MSWLRVESEFDEEKETEPNWGEMEWNEQSIHFSWGRFGASIDRNMLIAKLSMKVLNLGR